MQVSGHPDPSASQTVRAPDGHRTSTQHTLTEENRAEVEDRDRERLLATHSLLSHRRTLRNRSVAGSEPHSPPDATRLPH